jgi:hypothetical protein
LFCRWLFFNLPCSFYNELFCNQLLYNQLFCNQLLCKLWGNFVEPTTIQYMVPEFQPQLNANVLSFSSVFFWMNLTQFMTKLKVLVLSFHYFRNISKYIYIGVGQFFDWLFDILRTNNSRSIYLTLMEPQILSLEKRESPNTNIYKHIYVYMWFWDHARLSVKLWLFLWFIGCMFARRQPYKKKI